MAANDPGKLFEHPAVFGSARSWLHLLAENQPLDWRHWRHLARIAVVTAATLATTPLKTYASLRYGRRVASTKIHPEPIFIIGHWRSGTTHLHNVLYQDPALASISTWQAFAPQLCLLDERILKRPFDLVAKRMHPTREIDNMPLAMDNPEETDLAVAGLCPYSYLHMYSFPRAARRYMRDYVTRFDATPPDVRAEWARQYLRVLHTATLEAGGRRLVLKNCADSARIPQILDMFPSAKFIHIVRRPYDVYRSTSHLYKTVLAGSQVQSFDPAGLDAWVIEFYTELMQRYLADRDMIPPHRLVEVRFEDLNADPVGIIKQIYAGLELPGHNAADPHIRSYLNSISGYQKNTYRPLDTTTIETVNRHWSFAFDAFDYPRLEPEAA